MSPLPIVASHRNAPLEKPPQFFTIFALVKYREYRVIIVLKAQISCNIVWTLKKISLRGECYPANTYFGTVFWGALVLNIANDKARKLLLMNQMQLEAPPVSNLCCKHRRPHSKMSTPKPSIGPDPGLLSALLAHTGNLTSALTVKYTNRQDWISKTNSRSVWRNGLTGQVTSHCSGT